MCGEGIQSDPGNSICPVSSSAMMHPTDHTSAESRKKSDSPANLPTINTLCIYRYMYAPDNAHCSSESLRASSLTFLCVVHPVEHDLRGSPVSGGDVARHDLGSGAAQSEVQDLYLTVLTHSYVAGFQVLGEWEWENRNGTRAVLLGTHRPQYIDYQLAMFI